MDTELALALALALARDSQAALISPPRALAIALATALLPAQGWLERVSLEQASPAWVLRLAHTTVVSKAAESQATEDTPTLPFLPRPSQRLASVTV